MKQGTEAVCEFCEEPQARLSEAALEFPYGIGEDQVILTAVVPVWKCASCGESYTADGAERRQNVEISAYLGRMRPTEIRRLRERAELRQSDFAEAIGVGVATIKRWEVGEVVPSKNLNNLLVKFEQELDAREAGREPLQTSRWRTQRPLHRIEASHAFVLDLVE